MCQYITESQWYWREYFQPYIGWLSLIPQCVFKTFLFIVCSRERACKATIWLFCFFAYAIQLQVPFAHLSGESRCSSNSLWQKPWKVHFTPWTSCSAKKIDHNHKMQKVTTVHAENIPRITIVKKNSGGNIESWDSVHSQHHARGNCKELPRLAMEVLLRRARVPFGTWLLAVDTISLWSGLQLMAHRLSSANALLTEVGFGGICNGGSWC